MCFELEHFKVLHCRDYTFQSLKNFTSCNITSLTISHIHNMIQRIWAGPSVKFTHLYIFGRWDRNDFGLKWEWERERKEVEGIIARSVNQINLRGSDSRWIKSVIYDIRLLSKNYFTLKSPLSHRVFNLIENPPCCIHSANTIQIKAFIHPFISLLLPVCSHIYIALFIYNKRKSDSI